MKSLRQYALEAWAQEQQQQKHAEQKKKKRKAKKIEEEVEEMLPREAEGLTFERNLEDPTYGVVVTVAEPDGNLRFARDDDDDLAIIGQCRKCDGETLSKPISNIEELGLMIERFEPGSSHDCSQPK